MKAKIWMVTYTSEYENGEQFMNVDLFGGFDKASENINYNYAEVLREAKEDYPEDKIKTVVEAGYAYVAYPGHEFEWSAE